MPPLHVLTVTPGLPMWLLDHLLTSVEQALVEAGASRVWISTQQPGLAVMADLPAETAEPHPQPEDGDVRDRLQDAVPGEGDEEHPAAGPGTAPSSRGA